MWSREKVGSILRSKGFAVAVASALSLVSGSAGGYLIAEKKLRVKYDELMKEEIEKTKNFYAALYNKPSIDDLIEEQPERKMSQGEEEGFEPPDPKDISTYHKVAEEYGTPTAAEKVNIFSLAETNAFDYEARDAEIKEGLPYVISKDEFFENEPDYETEQLTYFESDDTLIDSKEMPVEDTEKTVGDDNLTKFGYGSGDQNIVFIRNDKLELLFEVVRSRGEYATEVLGFNHEDKRPLRKMRRYDE